MNTVTWAEKIFTKLIETNNSFALFLVLTILGIIIMTGAIVALFYLLVREIKSRITDRDTLYKQFEADKNKATKILSDKNTHLEDKLDEQNKDFKVLIVEQTKYLEQMKNVIEVHTDTIQEFIGCFHTSCNTVPGGK